MRHIWPYICGIICFAQMSPVLLFDEARHQAGKLQQIVHPEHRPTFTEDDLGIGGNDVGPLPRDREDVIVVDAQQEPRSVRVVPLADADELPAGERMERVGHADKTRAWKRSACSSG